MANPEGFGRMAGACAKLLHRNPSIHLPRESLRNPRNDGS